MFFVYILRSAQSGKFYTGQTNDLDRRMQEHNDQLHNDRKYTTRVRGEFPQMVSFERWPTEVHVDPRRLPRPQSRDQHQLIKTPVCSRLRFGGT